ncbi:O-antigen ligase family protein [Nakamurella lactea]|uniref:O-antigen ligase family protein n=1 Tax=Nakamurella lactea TaxID=459515 RepID=UPI0004064BB8|nr:O-antigen ligase family protein [Nakamurella lactea]
MLTVYVVLLLAIPSAMRLAPLGSAGAPSTVMAIGALFWWVWFHLHRNWRLFDGFQPVKMAILAWLISMFVVYAHAMSSPMSGDEISPADNGMLKLVGLSGIALIANDGIVSLERHRTVIRRLVIGVGLVAILGLLQYSTKQLFIDRIQIPGLTSGASGLTLAERSGLTRPSGTSTHPIEYGVVLTMVLPLCVAYAMHAPRRRWLYRVVLGAVALAVVLSISRSALLCAAVGLIVLGSSWSAAARLKALAFAGATAVVVYLSSPGVLGTLTNLFTGASDDPSIASRTGSFDVAGQFISRSPWLGRGFGTFLPKYWILDNGYLGLLIEGGVLGFGGLLIVIGSAIWVARQARKAARSDFDRELSQALVASVAAGACGLAFFDTFAFPQSAGTFFLLIGLAGASLRLQLADRSGTSATSFDDQAGFLPGIKAARR